MLSMRMFFKETASRTPSGITEFGQRSVRKGNLLYYDSSWQ